MAYVKCILGTVVLLTFYTWTDAVALRNSTDEQHELTISERLEVAKDLDTATGDGQSGAFRRIRRNADPCVNRDCKWDRSSDGNVYVPVKIDKSYSFKAQLLIASAMLTFIQSTCVRFIIRTNEPDYLYIRSAESCQSAVGRQGGAQNLDLKFPDCFELATIQHELLHALGFHHEQSRSDRDQHIAVNWKNIESFDNFIKQNTVNLGTPYDYNSVMHYSRHAASKNGKPTLRAVPYPVEFGTATTMSQTDIDRVNRLYCTNSESNRKKHTHFFSEWEGSGNYW